eukprot:6206373-Pleurochrysis_carterae.AAC.1
MANQNGRHSPTPEFRSSSTSSGGRMQIMLPFSKMGTSASSAHAKLSMLLVANVPLMALVYRMLSAYWP